MTVMGWLQIILVLVATVTAAVPLGGYIVRAMGGERTLFSPVLASAWTTMLEIWSILVIPVATVFAFGRALGRSGQCRAEIAGRRCRSHQSPGAPSSGLYAWGVAVL